MAKTSRILRYLQEFGRGGAVRRLLERVVPDPAPAQGPASVRWADLFWEHSPGSAVARLESSSVAQADLFGWLEPDAAGARSRIAETPPAKGEASVVRSRVEELARPAPASGVRKLRLVSPVRYADRRGSVNREEIARLLEVTRGVDGVRRLPQVELPRGPFFARVELWKGRPVGTPFVMERRAR